MRKPHDVEDSCDLAVAQNLRNDAGADMLEIRRESFTEAKRARCCHRPPKLLKHEEGWRTSRPVASPSVLPPSEFRLGDAGVEVTAESVVLGSERRSA